MAKNWQGRNGLSSDCTLNPMMVIALQLGGEHPCDRCNEDRSKCRGYDRIGNEHKAVQTETNIEKMSNTK